MKQSKQTQLRKYKKGWKHKEMSQLFVELHKNATIRHMCRTCGEIKAVYGNYGEKPKTLSHCTKIPRCPGSMWVFSGI